jgi:hypothetical protein
VNGWSGRQIVGDVSSGKINEQQRKSRIVEKPGHIAIQWAGKIVPQNLVLHERLRDLRSGQIKIHTDLSGQEGGINSMRSEIFSQLKNKGKMIGDILKRKPPIETDVVDLVAHIDEYQGKKVTVVGDAEFADEKVVPKFSSGMTMHPIIISETQTYHRLSPPDIASPNVTILFEEEIGNVSGEPPEKGDVYEGKVAVTGKVKMEKMKMKVSDEVLGIGEIKTSRPYIQASEVRPLSD